MSMSLLMLVGGLLDICRCVVWIIHPDALSHLIAWCFNARSSNDVFTARTCIYSSNHDQRGMAVPVHFKYDQTEHGDGNGNCSLPPEL